MNIRRRFIILFLSFAFCEVFVSQNNLFLKNFASSPIYTVFSFSDAGIDTLSSNSFITGGFQVRWSNGNGDSLTKNSFLQKTEVSGLTKWYRNYHLNGYDLTFQDLKVMPNKDILVGGQTSN